MQQNNRNIFLIILSVIIVGAILYYFAPIVSYVLFSWVLSMIGAPFMKFFKTKLQFKKFKIGNGLSAFLTLIIFIIVATVFFSIFIPPVIEQGRNLSEIDPGQVSKSLEEPVSQLSNKLMKIGLISQPISLERELSHFAKSLDFSSKLKSIFGSILGVLSGAFIAFFSILFMTFFFLKEQGLFVELLVSITPPKYEDKVRKAIAESTKGLTRYFGGVALQVTVISILVSGSLMLLGVKNAILIGFFAGLINVIPYVGPIIGALFGLFITISSNLDIDFYSEMVPLLEKVVIVFAVAQLLDNFVFQPFIFSSSIMAHPLEIFIVIMIGAQIGGILGMVLAIPSYTIIRIVSSIFGRKFELIRSKKE